MYRLICRALTAALLAGVLALAPAALARQAQPFLAPTALDLTVLLPSPPAPDSILTKAEIAELQALQALASEARKQQAIADEERNYQRFVATTSLAAADPAKLPLTVALVQRVLDTTEQAIAPAKAYFDRPRPPIEDPAFAALVPLPKSQAYPSGHATFATATAILLSDLVPEKRAELMARATDFSESRLILGVHHPTDIGAGYSCGALVATRLLADPAYRSDAAAARAELRAALGLN